ncbi:MAG: hypothetical protein A4E35_01948 [Methanoregula sp. PtaU1.Bin051]|nr:MAG: hypothetical protein A4E35_01948 [Methanoregula sp. PtaU1.Bin051]
MPRRPTTTEENVRLFLLPHGVMQGVCAHGGEVGWLEAKRVNHHYYTVRVRTRPVKREFQKRRLVKIPVHAAGDLS